MSGLPVLFDGLGDLTVVDPESGEALAPWQASDRALVHAVEKVAELDSELLRAKRALAHELRHRHGVGATHAGGYGFTIAESQSWPAGPVRDALAHLVGTGAITQADADRAMPSRPKPDARALKALAGRLAVSNPDAARVLADACTVSPASVRDIHPEAVDTEAAA